MSTPDRPARDAKLREVHDRLHRGVRGAETFETCVWCASFAASLDAALGPVGLPVQNEPDQEQTFEQLWPHASVDDVLHDPNG